VPAQPISCAVLPARPDTRRQAGDLLLAVAAVECHVAAGDRARVPPALLRDMVIIGARLAGGTWLGANADTTAAFTALQACWQPPPLPELDRILACMLPDRFGLPAPTAAAWERTAAGRFDTSGERLTWCG
jgi:hypothetical protein